MSRSLHRVLLTLANQTEHDKRNGVLANTSPVILVVSQKQRIIQDEFESIRRMMQGSFKQFPDLYLVFLTRNKDQFTEIIGDALNDYGRYKIIETDSIDPRDFGQELLNHFISIPMRVVVPFCHRNRDLP